MQDYKLVLKNVSKYYGYSSVLDRLCIEIETGEFFTIYGPNGAGKTTLLMILSTLAKPSGGEITIGDINFRENRDNIRKIIGLVSHSDYLYENLTAYENLYFFGSLYGVEDLRNRTDFLLEQMGLYDRRNDLIRDYSRGMKKRISIARSLIHDPRIVLFDEPFSGLDQKAINNFITILEWLKSNKRTVLLTTHNIKYIWHLSDRIGIMNNGRIDDTLEKCDGMEQKAEEMYRRVCGN